MIPNRLFDLALLYKKTKLWKKLWDTQMFAVRFSDGDIGYCCVMGMLGEYIAIAVYPGQSGLDSLRMLHDEIDEADELAMLERSCCQDCLSLTFSSKSELYPRDAEDITAYCKANGVSLRGKNAYPHFQRYRPGYMPWYLEDEADQRRMSEALEAALEVSDRLTREMTTPDLLGILEGMPYDKDVQLLTKAEDGWHWEAMALPPRVPVEWPPVIIGDDLTRARLERAPRKGEWAVKLFRHFQAATDQEEDEVELADLTAAPYFPWSIMIVDTKKTLVVQVGLSQSAEDYTQALAKVLADAVSCAGMPRKITVVDDRTQAALSEFCASYDIKLDRRKRCKPLQDALDNMLNHFLADPDFENAEAEVNEMLELLRQPDFVAGLPDEILNSFFTQVDPREVPGDVMEIMRAEAKFRGLIR